MSNNNLRITDLPKRIVAKARHVFDVNPVAEALRHKERLRILRDDFIGSAAYERMMTRYFDPSIDGLNSAELKTRNFAYRHFRKNRVLGAWRWLGLFEKRDFVRPYVFSGEMTGIDLGGARGPISLNVDICDRLETDIFKRPVRYHDISDIGERSLDYIWSSHTFEHLPDLDTVVARLATKLKPGGKLIALVPAYTCLRWRSGVHSYKDGCGDSSHLYTFFLERDEGKADVANACTIDRLIGRHLRLEEAEMVGDNSIFIVASHRG